MDFGFTERREVLKEMSIDFYPNEFSIILGHNGAGKSTLLKIISGIYILKLVDCIYNCFII